MRRVFALVILSCFSLASAAQKPERGFMEGHELVKWMRVHEALLERRPVENLLEAGLYQGYVLGVYDSLKLEGLMCTPDRVSVGQVMALVTKYLKSNPAKWSQPANLLVLEALANAFPCTNKPR